MNLKQNVLWYSVVLMMFVFAAALSYIFTSSASHKTLELTLNHSRSSSVRP